MYICYIYIYNTLHVSTLYLNVRPIKALTYAIILSKKKIRNKYGSGVNYYVWFTTMRSMNYKRLRKKKKIIQRVMHIL